MDSWLKTGGTKKEGNTKSNTNYTTTRKQMELQVLWVPKTNYEINVNRAAISSVLCSW